MRLGYSRPLEATDLYKLQDDRASGALAEKIIRSFEERQRKAEEYNTRLANGEISPGLKGIWWSIRGQRQQREREWREKTGKKKPSLAKAANDGVFWLFWSGGIMRLISDVSLVTSPLLVKVFPLPPLRLTESYTPIGSYSICPEFIHRPQDRTGSSSSLAWHRLRTWSLPPSGSIVPYAEPLFLPIHGYRRSDSRSTDYRCLQQGSYPLHPCSSYSLQRKTG